MSAASPLMPERHPERRSEVSVARALGSTTRAGIFDHLRETGAPATVREVAALFDLHPNVARTHLELLADAGLVSVGRRKHPGGGRPAKVYTARDDGAVPAPAPGGRSGADALCVRLLAALVEQRDGPAAAGPAGGAPTVRAHHVAAAESRRLVAALGPAAGEAAGEPSSRLEAAAAVALRALRPAAPGARVVRFGRDWVDIAGLAGMFDLLDGDRRGLGDALERGLLTGALAAAGVAVSLSEAGEAPGVGPLLRARVVAPNARRAAPAPAGAVDARGGQREAGVVRAMRAVTELQPGEVLEVLTEGPGSPAAFARWADRAGHELLGVERATDDTGRPAIRLLIRKGVS